MISARTTTIFPSGIVRSFISSMGRQLRDCVERFVPEICKGRGKCWSGTTMRFTMEST